jgi:hypothetical protein
MDRDEGRDDSGRLVEDKRTVITCRLSLLCDAALIAMRRWDDYAAGLCTSLRCTIM